MKKLLSVIGVATSLWLHPAFASADSLTYTGLGSGSWVTLQLGSVTETGWSGEINWLLKTPTDSIGKAVTTYCGDLFDDAKLLTQTVTTTTAAALDASILSGHSLSLGALPGAGSKAAYLLDTFGAGAHGSNAAAAGLQIAIWQAMFGINSFAYTAGAGVGSAANGYYQSLMNALNTNPSSVSSSTATYFDVANDPTHAFASANGQDQIVGSPEPGALALLLAAIGVGAAYRYRQGRRRVVA